MKMILMITESNVVAEIFTQHSTFMSDWNNARWNESLFCHARKPINLVDYHFSFGMENFESMGGNHENTRVAQEC